MRYTKHQIDQFAEVKTGYPLREGAVMSATGDARLVQMRNVSPDQGIDWPALICIDTKGRKEPDWLQDKDILFVGRGSRFFAALAVKPEPNTLAAPHFHVIRLNGNAAVLPEFLVWSLNNREAQKFYAANQEGSALPYISRKTLSSLSVALPDIETQKAIVATHACWKRQRRLMEELITSKETLIEAILDSRIHKGA